MDEPVENPPWYKRRLLPRWLPGWLAACLLGGIGLAIGVACALGTADAKVLAWNFLLGFAFVLVILSYTSLKTAVKDGDSDFLPPAWIRTSVLLVTAIVGLISWLISKFGGPLPQQPPEVPWAAWLLLGCAGWFVVRFLYFGWDVLRIVRAGGDDALALGWGTVVSLAAGGAGAFALVIDVWPAGRQGWLNLVAWGAILPGALMGVILDFYVGLRRWGAAARLLAGKLPVYQEQLREADPERRAAAARTIGRMGRHGAPALADLLDLLKDADAGVRAAAAMAILDCTGDEPEVPAAARASLKDSDLRVRIVAAATLIHLKAAELADVEAVLTEGSHHPEERYRRLAGDYLEKGSLSMKDRSQS